jgi:hypothetical protein
MGASIGDGEKKVDNNSGNNEKKWTWCPFSAPITIISQ